MSVRLPVRQVVFTICAAYPTAISKGQLGGYKALCEQALSPYPDHLLMRLADPRRGIIAVSRFLPSIAELCSFCEDYLRKEWLARPARNDDNPPVGIEYQGETPEQRSSRRKIHLDRWTLIKQEMAANDLYAAATKKYRH